MQECIQLNNTAISTKTIQAALLKTQKKNRCIEQIESSPKHVFLGGEVVAAMSYDYGLRTILEALWIHRGCTFPRENPCGNGPRFSDESGYM